MFSCLIIADWMPGIVHFTLLIHSLPLPLFLLFLPSSLPLLLLYFSFPKNILKLYIRRSYLETILSFPILLLAFIRD